MLSSQPSAKCRSICLEMRLVLIFCWIPTSSQKFMNERHNLPACFFPLSFPERGFTLKPALSAPAPRKTARKLALQQDPALAHGLVPLTSRKGQGQFLQQCSPVCNIMYRKKEAKRKQTSVCHSQRLLWNCYAGDLNPQGRQLCVQCVIKITGLCRGLQQH